jgi:hypothetical protein
MQVSGSPGPLKHKKLFEFVSKETKAMPALLLAMRSTEGWCPVACTLSDVHAGAGDVAQSERACLACRYL